MKPLIRSITISRTSHSNYIEAARQVLGELGGSLSSRDLVSAAQERGLVGNGKWVYHNFLRKIRDTAEFDTSRRGYVSLMDMADPGVVEPIIVEEAPMAEAEVVVPDPMEAEKPGDTAPILEEADAFVETA